LEQFTAADGTRIAWAEAGSGRPIVLLHGLMAHRGFFEAQAPLGAQFRLISIDLRGHGDSRGPGQQPALTELTEDVAALAEALDLEGAIGVGWSLGASVLWRVLAGQAGRRFAGAVIIDMTPKVLNEDGWTLGLTPEHCEARAAAFRDGFSEFAGIAGPAIFAPDGDGAALGTWAGEQFARNDGVAMGAIWASLVEADLRPLLPCITQPTLIVRGAQSPLYGPETAHYLARALPDARTVEFARSGHAPHLEEPERFNALVTQFAASLPRIRQPQTTN
jgi:pimeloyl-ACP methyl ester carboxylesterase